MTTIAGGGRLDDEALFAAIGNAALVALFLGVAVPAAQAAPEWELMTLANTTVAPGGELEFRVQLQNVGDSPTSGQYTVTAELPDGFTAKSGGGNLFNCPGPFSDATIECTGTGTVFTAEYSGLPITVDVDPQAATGTATTRFAVAGGDPSNPNATTVDSTFVSSTPPVFGLEGFDLLASSPGGGSLTQAASHPADAKTLFSFNLQTDPIDIFRGTHTC